MSEKKWRLVLSAEVVDVGDFWDGNVNRLRRVWEAPNERSLDVRRLVVLQGRNGFGDRSANDWLASGEA